MVIFTIVFSKKNYQFKQQLSEIFKTRLLIKVTSVHFIKKENQFPDSLA